MTVADPDLVVSCVEVAVIVADPAPAGVNTPLPFMLPILDGLANHVTELLKFPVPDTVDVQVDV